MAQHNYSYQKYNKETMARAVLRSASISTKHCIEISALLRGKKLARAKVLLEQAIALKKPIPFRRFNSDVGHKPGKGIAAGRYAVKASAAILKMLESVEANAAFKGLNTDDMVIVHINAHMGPQQWHYGRQRRRKMKNTHVELVVEEVSKKAEAKKPKKKKAAMKKQDVQKSSQEVPVKKPVMDAKKTAGKEDSPVQSGSVKPAKEKTKAPAEQKNSKEDEKPVQQKPEPKVSGSVDKGDTDKK